MKRGAAGALCAFLSGCGDGTSGPSPSTTSTTTTTAVPISPFEIRTLITVYTSNTEDAQWTEGTTRDDRIAEVILGVDTVSEGTTALDNEGLREELQDAIGRIDAEFTENDYRTAFDESRDDLLRFLNDADGDGWAIDGRHGAGRDWPYDRNDNDPDGWTAQIVVTVTRP
ncbi:MAG: hypothetical protein ACRD21_03870 [Vicinamibacteria bacterium]